MSLSLGQEQSIAELKEIANHSGTTLAIHGTRQLKTGALMVEISLALGKAQAGATLEFQEREHFKIVIQSDFPFQPPIVQTPHTRFAGHPHVQWKRQICLYQSPSTEWDASDGMFGFIARLLSWINDAEAGILDAPGAPMHPPVAYTGDSGWVVVPQANAPEVTTNAWIGVAEISRVSDRRLDIIGWLPDEVHLKEDHIACPAILLSEELPFEFPSKVSDLLTELGQQFVSKRLLLALMRYCILLNPASSPLLFIIGVPMRGIVGEEHRKQHLSAWYIAPDVVLAALAGGLANIDPDNFGEIGEAAEKVMSSWIENASVSWAEVMENRDEVTVPRDVSSPASWFDGKTVSVWGTGALGANVAELLVRAGVKKLILRDRAKVKPGLLVRQPFEQRDVGNFKVDALKTRLSRIAAPDVVIDARTENILSDPLDTNWTDDADVIIDTTASESVASKLELVRWKGAQPRVPIVSMCIGHRAERGLVTVSLPKHTGGPHSITRAAKVEMCGAVATKHFQDEFWPEQRHPVFQPEPGCSENTFVGSAADTWSLSASMLNVAANALTGGLGNFGGAKFITSDWVRVPTDQARTFSFRAEREIINNTEGYEIRLLPSAWKEQRAWIARSSRLNGKLIETGGVLFGERDDACRVIWITEVCGPPPDSQATATGFICGVAGMPELNQEKRRRTRGSVAFVGTWHTHPNSSSCPSHTDRDGMAQILVSQDPPCRKALLMVVGGDPSNFQWSASLFDRSKTSVETNFRSLLVKSDQPRMPVGLALSGGGSRAMAFHLGCLRALHDRGILDQVSVLSTVSGGSVIGAMFAYSNDSFESFDARVVEILRKGLQWDIVKQLISSQRIFAGIGTGLLAGTAATSADALKGGLNLITRATGLSKRGQISKSINNIQPPLQRWVSRTDAFLDVLRNRVYGNTPLADQTRNGLNIIINACELRTGTAFRFGNRESGGWRLGLIENNEVDVALAVCASAAYPMLLPALDRTFSFRDRQGNVHRKRVVLTDGGIYDNLGVTCLEPGRSSAHTYNVFPSEYIICCHAGRGQMTDESIPYWVRSRMSRCFDVVFRRVQDSAMDRLHTYKERGELAGFALPYLGQQDKSLPWAPSDLIRREDVISYPTDFAPMSCDDLERLTKRGEQLTRLSVDMYGRNLG